jgi:hypothetical protein
MIKPTDGVTDMSNKLLSSVRTYVPLYLQEASSLGFLRDVCGGGCPLQRLCAIVPIWGWMAFSDVFVARSFLVWALVATF